MGLLSQKLRSGVVELATDTGSIYASPTFVERAYLLWTFRNFPRLSRVVLNQRQRELIDKLCRSANLRQRIPAAVPIIGVIENVTLAAQRKSVAAAASVIAINSAEAHVAQAVGAGLKSALARVESRQPVLDVRIANLTERAASSASASPALFWGDREGRRKWFAPAVALSAAAVLLAGFVYVRHNREAPGTVRLQLDRSYVPAAPPAVAASSENATPGSVAEVVAKPSAAHAVGPSSTATVPLRATTVARPATPPSTNLSTAAAPPLPVSPPVARVEQAAQPSFIASSPGGPSPAAGVAHETAVQPPVSRMVIAAAPVSFGYPVAPSATLLGKVHLRIVIGPDGLVKDVSALSGNPTLAAAAVKAVRRWKYRPPLLNGEAVEAETNVTINFAGDDAVTIAYR